MTENEAVDLGRIVIRQEHGVGPQIRVDDGGVEVVVHVLETVCDPHDDPRPHSPVQMLQLLDCGRERNFPPTWSNRDKETFFPTIAKYPFKWKSFFKKKISRAVPSSAKFRRKNHNWAGRITMKMLIQRSIGGILEDHHPHKSGLVLRAVPEQIDEIFVVDPR